MNVLAVFIGGGLGSLCRYGISYWSLRYFESNFPWGTFISNMLACTAMALSIYFLKEKFQDHLMWKLFLLTGFCGGFSTFSAFSYENLYLLKTNHIALSVTNALVSLLAGFLVMWMILREVRLHE